MEKEMRKEGGRIEVEKEIGKEVGKEVGEEN